jgi:OmpA-OmpF porin, OOP family
MRTDHLAMALAGGLAAACAQPNPLRTCEPLSSWASPAYGCAISGGEAAPPPLEGAPPEPAPPPPRVAVTGDKIELSQTVQFETNSAILLHESEELLDEVAGVLNEHPEIKRVQIEGHTDSRDSDSYNLRLSRQRAEAVRKYLVGRGVAEKRLDAKGFGETKPIADNETEEGRYRNRRVELRILERE